jgi:hypothetical protein
MRMHQLYISELLLDLATALRPGLFKVFFPFSCISKGVVWVWLMKDAGEQPAKRLGCCLVGSWHVYQAPISSPE